MNFCQKQGPKNIFYGRHFVILGLIILGVLFGLDVATTQFILSNGGYEMNIFMKHAVTSEIFHAAVKISVLSLIAGVVFYSNKKINNSGTAALIFIIAFYIITVLHNLGSISAIV